MSRLQHECGSLCLGQCERNVPSTPEQKLFPHALSRPPVENQTDRFELLRTQISDFDPSCQPIVTPVECDACPGWHIEFDDAAVFGNNISQCLVRSGRMREQQCNERRDEQCSVKMLVAHGNDGPACREPAFSFSSQPQTPRSVARAFGERWDVGTRLCAVHYHIRDERILQGNAARD